jgi:hypothetical protein
MGQGPNQSPLDTDEGDGNGNNGNGKAKLWSGPLDGI